MLMYLKFILKYFLSEIFAFENFDKKIFKNPLLPNKFREKYFKIRLIYFFMEIFYANEIDWNGKPDGLKFGVLSSYQNRAIYFFGKFTNHKITFFCKS